MVNLRSAISSLKQFLKTFKDQTKIHTQEDIQNSQYFCLLPWIHTHILPDSKVIPCCVSPYLEPVGDLKHNSLKEIWNNQSYKTIRKMMLADRPVHSCRNCYEVEESGIKSMRKRMNQEFIQHVDTLNLTKPDGFHPNLKMRYFDIRFSNICNFKCRGCSPALSTKWYEDFQKLWDFKSQAPKLINALQDSPKLWDEIIEYLPYVETAYFAGGEPLLMDEHYQTLEKLIELNNTDIKLQYNTNLSILKFKKYDLIELWSHFKSVDLNVSLDDIESRGEYFRSGLKWTQFVDNLKTVQENCPHFYFQVNCTINLFNIHRIPEIHSFLYQSRFIDEKGFNFNTLLEPDFYRSQVLPEKDKKDATIKLRAYVKSLIEKFPEKDWSQFKADIENQLSFLNGANLNHRLDEFKNVTLKLDQIRSESFSDTYPELKHLVL